MGYEASLERAWDELGMLSLENAAVSFLGEKYQVRASERAVLQPSGSPEEQMHVVLILHYLIGLLKHGYHPSGEWIYFKETKGGELFWPAFRESAIEPLLQSFQSDPERLIRVMLECLAGRRVEDGDVAVLLMAVVRKAIG